MREKKSFKEADVNIEEVRTYSKDDIKKELAEQEKKNRRKLRKSASCALSVNSALKRIAFISFWGAYLDEIIL